MATREPPVVLAIGGHDPTGGAGLTADIQTLTALACHPVTAVTAVTVQDLHTVHDFQGVDTALLRAQCEIVLRVFPVRVIKLGMLGKVEALLTLAPLLAQSGLPLVVDPVLAAGDGGALSGPALAPALLEHIAPLATVMTPNTREALALTGARDADSAAANLLAAGCGAVLVTGTDAGDGSSVVHRLYVKGGGAPELLSCARLPGSYHGSGCTLASAISAYLAHGEDRDTAIAKAQRYTYASLRDALRFSDGQAIPKRRGQHD